MSFFIHTIGDRRLETRLRTSPEPTSPLVIIVHPDPNLGGSMNNPSVVAVEDAFFESGFSTLAFNYSKNPNPVLKAHGEKTPLFLDVSLALDWVMQEHSQFKHFWIAGISLGAYLAMQVTMRRPEILHFVVASIPLWQHDFSFLSPCPVSGLILKSNLADRTLQTATEAWGEKLSQGDVKVEVRTVNGTDPIFTRNTDLLKTEILAYLKDINRFTGKP